jgi:hypothetical protein
MKEEKPRTETAPEEGHATGHPFARGLLTGTAMGVGVGLLFAPRSGAQMR